MEEAASQHSYSTSDPAAVPLCVDLDGTLVRSDTLWETILQLVKRRPARIPPVRLFTSIREMAIAICRHPRLS